MKKIMKNATSETYCVRHCCKDTPKRDVYAEGGAVSINTDVKYEDTEITDTRSQTYSLSENNIFYAVTQAAQIHLSIKNVFTTTCVEQTFTLY